MGVLIGNLSSLGRRGANEDARLSDSSLLGGVSGQIGDGGAGCGVTVMWRIRDTAIVASAAISSTRRDDPVVVENTTKYGMELQRENEWQRGSVTYGGYC